MKSITADISRLRGVAVGDFLLSVDGVCTNLLGKSALDALLLSNFTSCQFLTRAVYESNAAAVTTATAAAVAATARPQNLSKEQLSLNKHGFYAKGTY